MICDTVVTFLVLLCVRGMFLFSWSGRPHAGLDCWSPNININRDPRWGRNQVSSSHFTSSHLHLYSAGVETSYRHLILRARTYTHIREHRFTHGG